MGLIKPLEIKQCVRCKKRYDFSIGFYEGQGYCKSCNKKASQDWKLKKMDGKHDQHSWEELKALHDKCSRCGLKRKRIVDFSTPGKYKNRYFVNDEWVIKRPKCNK